ncbi:hypothetical protein [Lysobacter gummosus]|uniref:hypothetical protein n=1 Tax=Lysobacter gummosus TaxID=262324 RepID=UPI003629187C
MRSVRRRRGSSKGGLFLASILFFWLFFWSRKGVGRGWPYEPLAPSRQTVIPAASALPYFGGAEYPGFSAVPPGRHSRERGLRLRRSRTSSDFKRSGTKGPGFPRSRE